MLPNINDTVQVPADRGDKPYTGKVVQVGDTKSVSHQDVPFVWATVRHPSGTEHVWPSNRIGYALTAADLIALEDANAHARRTAASTPGGASAPAPARRMKP